MRFTKSTSYNIALNEIVDLVLLFLLKRYQDKIIF